MFLKKIEITLNDPNNQLTKDNAKKWADEWLEFAD